MAYTKKLPAVNTLTVLNALEATELPGLHDSERAKRNIKNHIATAARVYVNGAKHTAYYTLNTRNNRPVWCPEHVWQKALDYDSKTMF